MRVKCPHCETGELVKDYRQAYYVVLEGDNYSSLIEPTNYDPDEMNNEIYCDRCLTFISKTEMEQIVNNLKEQENDYCTKCGNVICQCYKESEEQTNG